MAGVFLRVRAEFRRHLLSWAVLALIVGVVGGSVLALTAGARRTATAYARFLERYPASDYVIADSSDFGFSGQFDLGRLERMPEIERSSRVAAVTAVAVQTGDGRELIPTSIVPFAPQDETLGRDVDAWKLIDGRRADPKRADEVVIGFTLAREQRLRVGSTLRVEFILRDTLLRLAPAALQCMSERVSGRPSAPCRPRLLHLDPPDLVQTFRVVGIEASALEFPPYEGNLGAPVHTTRAFADRHAAQLAHADLLFVKLRDGVDGAKFLDQVETMNPNAPLSVVSVGTDHSATVERSIRPQALGLGVLAALVGIAVAYALGQGFARQTFLADEHDLVALRTLGMTNRQLLGISVVRSGITALVAAVLAVVVAVALSPSLPVGLARDAEPAPGVTFDAIVLVVGSLALVALALVVSGVTTARAIARLRPTSRSSRTTLTARLVGQLRLPVATAIGARNALDPGRGRTAVPVRGAMIAMILAVGVSAASATVAASIDHLLVTPALYGWSRDAQIGTSGNPPVGTAVGSGLAARTGVRAYAIGTITDVGIGGRKVSAFALDDQRGEVPIDLLAGRRPRADDEIVFGSKTMDELGIAVDERVAVDLAGRRVDMTVVGQAVFSTIGNNGQLGRGAQITWSALRRVLPNAPTNVVHVDFVRDADEAQQRDELQNAASPIAVFGPAPPTELTNFGRVDNLPALLALAMGVLATIILAHALLASVHRRRRDYATLSALGFGRRQTVVAVVTQASTFAFVSVVVGVPVGIVIGARAWSAIASELGVPSEPVASSSAIALLALASLMVAATVAIAPAWIAGRTRASTELRTG